MIVGRPSERFVRGRQSGFPFLFIKWPLSADFHTEVAALRKQAVVKKPLKVHR